MLVESFVNFVRPISILEVLNSLIVKLRQKLNPKKMVNNRNSHDKINYSSDKPQKLTFCSDLFDCLLSGMKLLIL